MKRILPFIVLLCWQLNIQATVFSDSSLLVSLNQQIDNYVVAKDTAALKALYADDFVFSHGSGKVEGKQSWFGSVGKGNFISRHHDSVTVKMDLYPKLAIVKGKLSVAKKANNKTDRYHLYYVRVYAYRDGRWQLTLHVTTSEYHEPA